MDRPRNRPRNRQPPPGHQTRHRGGKPPSQPPGPGRHPFSSSSSYSASSSSPFSRPRAPATPQQRAGTVPSSQEVLPGAAVFIILKQDQFSQRETKGVVSEVLTSGDHPRGIKVRLRDGSVGRVQRLDGTPSSSSSSLREGPNSESVELPVSVSSPPLRGGMSGGGYRARNRYTDVRSDAHQWDGPPPRTLADYMTHLDSS